MTTYFLHIPPSEVVRLVKAEQQAAEGQPELYADAWEDYVIEEDYDRAAYGLHDGSQYDLVSVEAELDIEPRVEQDYWVLSVVAHRDIGPQIIEEENALVGADLTLDEFAARFLAPDYGTAIVRLEAQTPRAKRHFDHWWAEMSARHRMEGNLARADRMDTSENSSIGERIRPTGTEARLANTWTYRIREAVGVYASSEAMEAAMDELETTGFDRASVSVLGTGDEIRKRLEYLYDRVAEVEDGRAARGAPSSRNGRAEGEAAAIAVPFYVGGFAGAAAVVASGGVLAMAIGATILGAATGAGLGAILAHAVARRHAKDVEEQLARGGLILWVNVPDADAEKQAIAVLTRTGARDIHVHEIEKEWGPHDRPLAEGQVASLLDHDATS